MSSEILRQHPQLKGFAEHGVNFTRASDTQAIGDCPFCGKVGHFYVNHDKKLWDCKVCGLRGGFGNFLSLIAEANQERFIEEDAPCAKLAESRGLSPATLRKWGVGWDGVNYTIPVRSLDMASKHLTDLRRYRIGQKSMCSSGGKIGLVGAEGMASKDKVWLCEGEWDAMAMDEMLSGNKLRGVCLGLTGAEQFKAEWASAFTGRDVTVVFDNDDAGIRGENKVFQALRGAASKLSFIHWPSDNPKGYDLREYYMQHGPKGFKGLNGTLTHPEPRKVPGDVATVAAVPDATQPNGRGLPYEKVVEAYRKYLHLPDAEPLEVLFGATFANRLAGDPLWLFMVADAGGTKSELLMSLDGAPNISTTSNLTPHSLVSGANFAGGGDPSLIPKLDGKVLVIKDFTVVLSMHYAARDEIFSVLRDAYDGKTEKVFGTGVHRVYISRFGILAGVTPVIEQFNAANAALGERFLRYRIRIEGKVMRGSEHIRRAISNSISRDGLEEKARATLKEIAFQTLDRKVDANNPPKISRMMIARLTALAQYTAVLRGVVAREKYTGEIPFRPVVEVGTRLGKQLAKLAMGVAIFHQRDEVNLGDYQIVTRVARNTVPEIVEEIVRCCYQKNGMGFVPTSEIAECCHLPTGTASHYMQDLLMLHVLEKDPDSPVRGGWRLSPQMFRLIKQTQLFGEEEAT